MRHTGITITGVGVRLGEQVRTPPLVRKGLLPEADVRRTGQRSVCVSSNSGPELAVQAAREAVRQHQDTVGTAPVVGLHLHTAMHSNTDSWSTACYVLDQLGVSDARMATDLGTAANGVFALDMAASILGARPDIDQALITCGDQFGSSQFHRSSVDHNVLFGDAGAALVLTRDNENDDEAKDEDGDGDETPDLAVGFGSVVATAEHTDPTLEGLSHGLPPATAALNHIGESVEARAWKQAWLEAHGGPAEVLRRHMAAVTQTVKTALTDADLDLDNVRWILCPFTGYDAVEQMWLNPLGFSAERTLTLLGLHFGHLGTSDQIVGLYHLLVTRSVEPGDHVLLVAASPGMTWTAAVVQITTDHLPGYPWRRETETGAPHSSMGDR
jgi:3-oxoacyl-[acyl-carrier-protein] synthase-3